MGKKLTKEQALLNINNRIKDNKDIEFLGFLNDKWIGNKTNLIFRCKIHKKMHYTSYKSFIAARGWKCIDCYHESRKISPEIALKNILRRHENNLHNYIFIVPNDFNISEGREDITCICPIHGKFIIKYSYLIKRSPDKVLCPRCNNIRGKLMEEDIISDVVNLINYLNEQGNNVSFLGIYGKFNGNKTKIKLQCNIHNEIGTPYYYSLMKNKSWMCNKCRTSLVKKSNTLTPEEAQRRVSEKFKNDLRGYDYSKIKETFTGYNNDVIVICPIHGEFKIKFRTLISSRKNSGNCPKCLLEEKTFKISKGIEIVKSLLSSYNIYS